MADRICSCCGKGYTDKEGHDYEQCYRDCEEMVNTARRHLNDLWDRLGNAESRREAHRKGLLK